jgi:hypothetical protein
MPEDDFLRCVTSKQWREHLCAFLLCEADPDGLEKCCSNELLSRLCFDAYHEAPSGDPTSAAKWYVEKDLLVPPTIVLALLDRDKPHKGGRHTHRKQWAQQRASDVACYLAMKHLFQTHQQLSQTAAAELVGRLVGLSPQAVARAWKKHRQVLETPPETHP